VKLLLEKRASPHAQDEEGATPLHFAAGAGCWESCKHLLAAGACKSVLDDQCRTPMACLPPEYLVSRKARMAWAELLAPAEVAARFPAAAAGCEDPPRPKPAHSASASMPSLFGKVLLQSAAGPLRKHG